MYEIGLYKHLLNNEEVVFFIPVFDDYFSPGGASIICEQVLNKDQYFIQYEIEDGMYVLDIGSSFGAFSYKAAKLGAKVFSFEPNLYEYKALCKLNDYHNLCLTTFNFGLGEKEKESDLFLEALTAYGSGKIVDNNQLIKEAKYKKHKKANSDEIIPAKVRTLDNIWDEGIIEKADIIKMDTEGYERMILQGGKRFIQEFHPLIVMSEYHLVDDNIYLEAKLRDLGYTNISHLQKPFNYCEEIIKAKYEKS